MSSNEVMISFNSVSKKYKLGFKKDALRDAIPHFFKSLIKKESEHSGHPKYIWALNNVNFQVKKGEFLGIIGPNGAGKSTILKIISKITKPTQGFVSINGRVGALIEIGAGFHPDLTGRENIYLNGSILGLKKKEIDEKFDRIVEFSELEQFLDTPVKRYSSGMYVRLGFSVAAHLDPDILLIDEVLAVGDMSFQEKCLNRIRHLKENKTTVVFISHNLGAVQKVCNRAIYLKEGQIAVKGETAMVINDYKSSLQRKWNE
jgi:lipopolysaccharide transport system ATP-binding protein